MYITAECLPNGLTHLYDQSCGLTCCLESDGTYRHGVRSIAVLWAGQEYIAGRMTHAAYCSALAMVYRPGKAN